MIELIIAELFARFRDANYLTILDRQLKSSIFLGFSKDQAAINSEAKWRIFGIYLKDGAWKVYDSGTFDKVWNDRLSVSGIVPELAHASMVLTTLSETVGVELTSGLLSERQKLTVINSGNKTVLISSQPNNPTFAWEFKTKDDTMEMDFTLEQKVYVYRKGSAGNPSVLVFEEL